MEEPDPSPQRRLSEAGHFLERAMTPYRTPAGFGTAELTERGSRFIGVCACLTEEDAAKAFIASAREKHPGASHTVYAYRLRAGATRFSDDGEPSGTAGMPVLDVLSRRDLWDAALAVTRYFGGTLLGTGGLVRAYGRVASMAADAAGVAELRPWREGTVTVPYALYDQTLRLLTGYGARVSPSFGADVSLLFQAPEQIWDVVSAALCELTAGKKPEALRAIYLP